MREAVCDIVIDGALALNDFINAPRRNAEIFGEVPDAYSSRGEKFFQ
jgi:hypothetical protein